MRTPVKAAEALMGMDASTWARHANPWSGWSRLNALPILAVVLDHRVRLEKDVGADRDV